MSLKQAKSGFKTALPTLQAASAKKGAQAGGSADVSARTGAVAVADPPAVAQLDHGAVVIAAITSCTNTSNPSVMIGAGLLAKKAVERGLMRKPWVKTSLAPGSKVVTEYLRKSGLDTYLDQLGFNLVGYGCTTCIGNSGPLPDDVSAEVDARRLVVASVLSGNRNFEGRIQQQVRANYLASPPLVVAYALAGRMTIDLTTEPLGTGTRRRAGLPARPLADRARDSGNDAARGQRPDVPRAVRRRVQRRRPLAVAERADRRSVRVGAGLHLHPEPAVLRRHHARSRRRSPTSPARGRWRCSATASPPTTSRRPDRSRRTARRGST